MEPFNPYSNWLGIPPHEQPPNYYRLLGIVLFESNPRAIEQAADQQSLRVGAYQAGPQGELCQQLMSEIAMAQFCLLDPQQKAAYDAQLYATLGQRGECLVAAAPPPIGGMQQFGPSQAAPMSLAAPLPPMQAAMGLSPSMPMPAAMAMSPGFAPAMPHRSAPVAMPVAVRAAAPAAPPSPPPAAPQRAIDELESLASQPTNKRRFLKKKPKEDHSKEIIIGGVVAVGGVLLLLVFLAVKSQDTTTHGFEGITPDEHKPSVSKKLAEEKKQKLKDLAKEKEKKEKEKEKENRTAAAQNSGKAGETSPLKPLDRDDRQPRTTTHTASDDGPQIVAPHSFGPPSRKMDSPDSGDVGGGGAAAGGGGRTDTGGGRPFVPQPNGHDGPQDLGGDKDPVFEIEKQKPEPEPEKK
jgi:hypothetical protein